MLWETSDCSSVWTMFIWQNSFSTTHSDFVTVVQRTTELSAPSSPSSSFTGEGKRRQGGGGKGWGISRRRRQGRRRNLEFWSLPQSSQKLSTRTKLESILSWSVAPQVFQSIAFLTPSVHKEGKTRKMLPPGEKNKQTFSTFRKKLLFWENHHKEREALRSSRFTSSCFKPCLQSSY